jgi:1-phosphofructokinase family hexose kinase
MTSIFTITLNPGIDRELTVPAILFDNVLRSTSIKIDFGGKGLNVSRMLKELGTPSTALGFIGGKSGEFLQEGLESLGILTDFVWTEGESRTNFSLISEQANHHIKVNEPGPTITTEEQNKLYEKISDRCQPGDWWIISGSLPPGVPADYYSKLITTIQSHQGKAILDTSGNALAEGCRALPYLVKPNQFELSDLTNLPVKSNQQVLLAAEKVRVMGPSIVIVSLGKVGALLTTKKDSFLVNSPTIKERNPIGAGDSLTAGLVWAFSQGISMEESLRWGVACGAATTSLDGTAVGTFELVKELFPMTEVKKLTK